ncbi:Septin-2 [Oopsacas minuta]|uniref:Septin-2 n=1 Tax=Oopsacas minuta TaxID=111878 RepID=A0AAV7JY16_9METZ|nr:Septin-2 [Oopsacas minuta]
MDQLENVYIPDSPCLTFPDVIIQSEPGTPEANTPNSKRRLIIRKKSPSTQNISSLLTDEENEPIGSTLRMQQSFNCARDIPRDLTKRKTTPPDGLVSERLKQWKENIAKEANTDFKPTNSPLIARYKRQQVHSQPTTPTKHMLDTNRRLRNTSIGSTVSDTSSSGISDRSEILKSPISSSDASEIRTSPSSDRSQPCYSVSSQESDQSLSLDSPVKSHTTTIEIPRSSNSPPMTTGRKSVTTTCTILKGNDTKEKVRYYSEGSNNKPVSPVNTNKRPSISSLNNNSPFNSHTSSPTPSESGTSTSTPTDKITFPPPPVIKPKPKLSAQSKPLTSAEPTVQVESQEIKTSMEDVTPIEDTVYDQISSSPIPEPPIIETINVDTAPQIPVSLPFPSPVEPKDTTIGRIKEVSSCGVDNIPISSYLQINTLSDRIFKKNLKRGLEFTILIVGEAGLGKTTLIDSLFESQRCQTKTIPAVQERKMKTTQIEKHQVEFVQRGVTMKVNIIDTPGFGDCMDGTDCCVPILDYINNQFESFYSDESGMNRRHIQDTRVHACLYFISPNGHGQVILLYPRTFV